MFRSFIHFFFIVLLCLGFINPEIQKAYADQKDEGFLLVDDQGSVLAHQNETELFAPASILKISTALAAIKTLGEDFHFKTEYCFETDQKNLYLKGYGDPFFISEAISLLADELAATLKAKSINNIVLDDTYFSKQITIPGKGRSLNPYDSPVGALSANFNTVFFKWDTRQNKFITAEPQTPLLEMFVPKIKDTGLTQGRIMITGIDSRLYAGRLLSYFLKRKNIDISGTVSVGTIACPPQERHEFYSPYPLKFVIQNMLKYSNNFIANQLMLVLGTQAYGPPADLEKGIKVLKKFAKTKIGLKQIQLAEGSGLSRKNRISPVEMIQLLERFKPHYTLLNHHGPDYYKTGTLTGVRTRAGYFEDKDKRLYPYVIMVNADKKGYGRIYKKLIKIVQEQRGPAAEKQL